MAASSESEQEPAPAAPVMIIEKRWVIKTRAKSMKWWVACTRDDSQGRAYIKLSKFDRSFVYFCLGRGMDLNRSVSANTAGFDTLLQKRKAASVQAVHKALETDETSSQSKKRRVREDDRSLCSSDWVTIELDEVQTENGESVGGFGARVLWGLDSSTLYIELTEPNLSYMRELVKSGQQSKGKTRSTAAKSAPKASPKLKRKKRFQLGSPAKPQVAAHNQEETLPGADTQMVEEPPARVLPETQVAHVAPLDDRLATPSPSPHSLDEGSPVMALPVSPPLDDPAAPAETPTLELPQTQQAP